MATSTSPKRMQLSEKRSPFPIPYGWFQVGYSHELPIGGVEPVERMGRYLVMWRD